MTSLTEKQINWLDKCTDGTGSYGRPWVDNTWTLNPKTGLVDVYDGFDCSKQGLSDFKGVKFGVVNGGFYCLHNQLTSLVGAPQRVGLDFLCDNNRLTSLVGAPKTVGGSFDCGNNRLTSLEGAPRKIGWRLDCYLNPVSQKTLNAIFLKMQEGRSFVIAAASLRNEMSKKDWKLIAKHIPEAIQPGASMLARFGVFG